MGIAVSEKNRVHQSRSIDGDSKDEDESKIDQRLIETVALNLLVYIYPLYV